MSYIRGTGGAPAKIMVVVDYPSAADVNRGTIFSDSAGGEFQRMLLEAGGGSIPYYTTCFMHVNPIGNDTSQFIAIKKSDIKSNFTATRDRYVAPIILSWMQRLAREIELVRPSVIIALGNAAMWALTGKWGITSWRGSQLLADLSQTHQCLCIPTYSPSQIFRKYDWRQPAVQDIRRALRKLDSGFLSRDYSGLILEQKESVLTALHTLYQTAEAHAEIGKKFPLAVDLETKAGVIEMIGIAWDKKNYLVIPFMSEKSPHIFSEDTEVVIISALKAVLTHKAVEVYGQNFSYDAQYTARWWGFIPNLAHDTMLAQHVIFSSGQKSLDFLASLWCEDYVYWKDELDSPDPIRREYCAKDCCNTWEIADAQVKYFTNNPILGKVNSFQQKLWWPVVKSMLDGIRIDHKNKSDMAGVLMAEIQVREVKLHSAIGRDLNTSSPTQLVEFLYTELGLPVQKDKGTGNPSTGDEALTLLGEAEPMIRPFCKILLELRSLKVFLSTFVLAPVDYDGRMRCSFNIAGTETYRFSSSKNAFGSGMNLQNVPKGSDSATLTLPNIRSLFLPDDGKTFFDIDLSSADLRIVVWEADEPAFKKLLKDGLDPYTEFAKHYYKNPDLKKSSPERQLFKSIAHGTNYLGTAKGLAERLHLSVSELTETQKWYFTRFPRIRDWQEYIKDQVRKTRSVKNIFGYRTVFLDRIEGTIFNQAVAWIPQSTVACIINRAYLNIYENLKDVQVLLQVHDSLAGQFPSTKPELEKAIIQQAEIVLPYGSDPLIIPVGCKTSTVSWGDCE